MGLYIGLLPAWGSLVKANILNMETMRTYANSWNTCFKLDLQRAGVTMMYSAWKVRF